jgi:hypothetical protein
LMDDHGHAEGDEALILSLVSTPLMYLHTSRSAGYPEIRI